MKTQIISFQCTIKNRSGSLLVQSTSCNVLNKLDGGNTALQGLILGMQDLKKGELRTISLSAEQAYGLYDPTKVVFFPRDTLPKVIKIGQFLTLVDTSRKHRLYRVVQVQKELVTLDGNHPLAGQDLIFEIATLDARDASDAEINRSQNLLSEQVLH